MNEMPPSEAINTEAQLLHRRGRSLHGSRRGGRNDGCRLDGRGAAHLGDERHATGDGFGGEEARDAEHGEAAVVDLHVLLAKEILGLLRRVCLGRQREELQAHVTPRQVVAVAAEPELVQPLDEAAEEEDVALVANLQ